MSINYAEFVKALSAKAEKVCLKGTHSAEQLDLTGNEDAPTRTTEGARGHSRQCPWAPSLVDFQMAS